MDRGVRQCGPARRPRDANSDVTDECHFRFAEECSRARLGGCRVTPTACRGQGGQSLRRHLRPTWGPRIDKARFGSLGPALADVALRLPPAEGIGNMFQQIRILLPSISTTREQGVAGWASRSVSSRGRCIACAARGEDAAILREDIFFQPWGARLQFRRSRTNALEHAERELGQARLSRTLRICDARTSPHFIVRKAEGTRRL